MPTREPRTTEVQIDTQLTETIRQLHEVSSRIDERIKHLIEKQNSLADKVENIINHVNDGKTRLTVLEKSGIDDVRDDLEDLDKKMAILEKQLNNGIRSDVDDLKVTVKALELSNEHHTSFRTKGEQRLNWWFDVLWKSIWTIAGAFILYKMGIK